MITTMDRAGRLVVPKAVRDAVGLAAGEVQVEASGGAVMITVPASPLVKRRGLLMLANGAGLGDEQVRAARLDGQR
ncbi:MAG: AbrB/MazE/SpoVT family DNA-binding domain-containing protein [Micrococcales bacterium]|nr:AbrB/MazE/SpoVT family DNA-binding domain-containing protein [Micrococcales bacterium]